MKFPPLYTAFCLLVLSGFVYTKYRGLDILGAERAAAANQGNGGHSSGTYIGSHK
jgi:hypothetical protein